MNDLQEGWKAVSMAPISNTVIRSNLFEKRDDAIAWIRAEIEGASGFGYGNIYRFKRGKYSAGPDGIRGTYLELFELETILLDNENGDGRRKKNPVDL